MKEHIIKISEKLKNDEYTTEQAQVLLLGLFSVSGILPDVLGVGNHYSLKETLKRLKWATNYLLHEKNYDGHAYEELNQCVKRADEIIAILECNYH